MRLNALLAATLLIAPAAVFATPIYFVFAGTITASNVSGYDVGQAVQYRFMADPDQPGVADHLGAMEPVDDVGVPGGDVHYNYYSADYLGGSAFPGDGTGTAAWNRYHLYYGYDLVEFGASYSEILGSNQDETGYDFISVLKVGSHIADWTVGECGFLGFNFVDVDAGPDWEVSSDLHLASISGGLPPIVSVPEPGTAGLLALGLACLALGGQRLRRSRRA